MDIVFYKISRENFSEKEFWNILIIVLKRHRKKVKHASQQYHRTAESQDAWGWKGSSRAPGPTTSLKQGFLQAIAQDSVQAH